MLEHKEESKNERLSDVELAEMRAMLADAKTGRDSATGQYRGTYTLKMELERAAPESMGKLLDEVERLRRELAELSFYRESYESAKREWPAMWELFSGKKASDD